MTDMIVCDAKKWFAAIFVNWVMIVSLFSQSETNINGEYVTDTNTVLLLHLNEKAGLPKDSSSYANHPIACTATWVDDGKFGACLSFSGTNSIVIKNHKSLTPSNFTVEAWFYPKKPETGRLIMKGDGCVSGAGYCLSWCGYEKRMGKDEEGKEFEKILYQRFTGWIHDESGAIREPQSDILSPSSLNRWHHAAITYDGYTLRLYVDGRLSPATSGGEDRKYIGIKHNDTDLIIGLGFWGLIDEVRISDKARLPDEMIGLNMTH